MTHLPPRNTLTGLKETFTERRFDIPPTMISYSTAPYIEKTIAVKRFVSLLSDLSWLPLITQPALWHDPVKNNEFIGILGHFEGKYPA
jgi:hypothetical protein